jgi:two-component system, LytTR family, response regulator
MTTRWRVVAVDDEPPALHALEQAFRTVPDYELIATMTDPMSAAERIAELRPDVLLLDIQMPGRDGFELLEELHTVRAVPPAVVFCTAYHEHALRAFDAQAIDYLLKPLDPARFRRTLDLLRQRLPGTLAPDTVRQLRALLLGASAGASPAGHQPARLSIKVDGRTVLLDPRTIDRLELRDEVVRIHAGRDRFDVRSSLSSLSEQLPAEQFLRVHRAAVVNVSRVRMVEPYLQGDYILHLLDGSRVVTGRTYRDVVRATFQVL